MRRPRTSLVAALAAGVSLFSCLGCGSKGGGPVATAASDLDGDGVANAADAFPNDPAASVDTDGDGSPDSFNAHATSAQLAATALRLDAFPSDPAAAVDSDGDGKPNDWNPTATSGQILASALLVDDDDDNDTFLDIADAFPLDPSEWLNTDGDNLGDNADPDDDNDNMPDVLDAFPLDPAEQLDTDRDGIGNNADPDDDNDGILDGADPFPLVSASLGAVPEPVNLGLYLRAGTGVNTAGFPNVDPTARAAAIALGKALFWDMNVGSDLQACASCHFHAGADNRASNQINPGVLGGDALFHGKGPNQTLEAADFPLHQRSPVDSQTSATTRDNRDVVSSQGVFLRGFLDVVPGSHLETFTPVLDPTFQMGGVNARRVEPRNTPTVINAVYNFTNFWDGRARNIFNGVNPFGELDRDSGVLVQTGGILSAAPERVRMPDASLASQAVGPPLSDFEMSGTGRTFPKLGKKLLAAGLKPLSRQVVDPTDSVLGTFADAAPGLAPIGDENAYVALIKLAFQPRYWDSPGQHVTLAGGTATVVAAPADPANPDQYTQMEANFSLFFGLAIQLYEATLVSDDSKFDRVARGLATFTPEEQDGFGTFTGAGECNLCHIGNLFTAHTVSLIRAGLPPQGPGFLPAAAVEPMGMAQGIALYDAGIYNLGATRTTDDVGRGADSPFLNPVTNQPYPLSMVELGLLKLAGQLPADVAMFVPNIPVGVNRVAVNGAFKTPTLRNVELTGPYFHNGGMSTLLQAVEFYTRGGNFPSENLQDLDPIGEIGRLRNAPDRRANLVAFLLTLTDDRVKFKRAPFDHPQLFLPAGDGLEGGTETLLELPAVGAAGTAQPLPTFLNLDPHSP